MNGLSPEKLVIIATIGNVIGSLTNYGLGYWAGKTVIQRWLRMSESEFVRAEERFKKYGIAALLFAWVPIIGDPLTVMAGILRIRMLWFLALVTIGKFLRYYILATLILQ